MTAWDGVALRSYACDLCGADESAPAFEKAGKLIRRPFTIVRCPTCGHVRVNPRIPDELIPKLYDAEYYAGRGFDTTVNYEYEAGHDYRQSPIVQQIVATVVQLFPKRLHPRALDIGCGLGDIVLGMREHGVDSYGVDASPFARKVLSERHVPTLPDFDENAERYAGSFDLITCVEVIEHVTSPKAFLRFVRTLLRPGGYLFILTGNWNVQRRVPGTPYVMPEGHIQYFTPGTLAKFYKAASLECVQVPVNYAWYVNRTLQMPVGLRRALQFVTERLTPGLGPLPIGRRSLED